MGFDGMTFYWTAKKLHRKGVPIVPEVLQKAIYLLHNSFVPYEAEIGEGTQLGYGGMGVVIHKDARIGKHCLISQQVTIGGGAWVGRAPARGHVRSNWASADTLSANTN